MIAPDNPLITRDHKDLPSISDARLPASYEAAQVAIAACHRIDECKEWADKSAALASYARQSKDETMERMAQRIRARAIRRTGELLVQIEPGNGANQNISAASDTNVLTRKDAAESAGMSKRQQVTAIRLASIPAPAFEAQIEAERPATVTALAAQGTKPRTLDDLKGRDPRRLARPMPIPIKAHADQPQRPVTQAVGMARA